MLPDLSGHPLAAALLGGVFVGIGVGMIVRQGGSSGGDDALALVISKGHPLAALPRLPLHRLHRAGPSLTYIPVGKIACSVVTVTVSSFLIDRVQDFKLPGRPLCREPAEKN